MNIIKYILCAILFVGVAKADTINIDWIDGDTTYTQTTCTVGGDIILPEPPTKRGYIFTGWSILIPSEYDRLEYIESDGDQWIDTGIILNQDSSVKAVAQTTVLPAIGATYGSRISYDDSAFAVNLVYNDGRSVFLNYGNSINNVNSIPTTTDKIVIYQHKNQVYINDILVWKGTYKNFQTPGTAYLFAWNVNGNVSGNSTHLRIYSFQIWDDEALVRDFVPVRDPSNGKTGMYDTVSETFFANQGTGEFIAGPVVYE